MSGCIGASPYMRHATPRSSRPFRLAGFEWRSLRTLALVAYGLADVLKRLLGAARSSVSTMVFHLNDRRRRITRHDLADPHRHTSLEDRLINAGAHDLRDNSQIIDQGGGYVAIEPIDSEKRWTAREMDPETPLRSDSVGDDPKPKATAVKKGKGSARNVR